MIGLLWFVLAVFAWPFRSNARLEAENAVLRQQLLVLRRKCRGRVRLTNGDRLFFVQLYRWFPSVLQVLHILRPETLVRWHRAGFRSYWRGSDCDSDTLDRGRSLNRVSDTLRRLSVALIHSMKPGVCLENLDSDVMVMKSAENGARVHSAKMLDRAS